MNDEGLSRPRLGVAFFLAVLLAVLTLAVSHPLVRFERAPTRLLLISDGSTQSAAMQIGPLLKLQDTSSGLAMAVTRTGRGVASLHPPATAGFHLLKLTGEVSVRREAGLVPPGDTARLLIRQPEALSPVGHLVISWPNSVERDRFERIVAIIDRDAPVRLDFELTRSSGQLILHRFNVAGLVERFGMQWCRSLLQVGWVGLLLLAGWKLMRHVSTQRLVIVSVFCALLIFGMLLAPDSLGGLRREIGDLLLRLLPLRELSSLDAIIHFLAFAALAALLYTPTRNHGRLQAIGWLILLATATEMMQLLIDGRQASMGDLFYDITGIFLGIALARSFQEFSDNYS